MGGEKYMKKVLPSGITPKQLEHLRSLVNKFDTMQDARIAFENQIRAVKDETTSLGRLGFIFEEGVVKGATAKVAEPITYRKKQKRILGVACYEKELEKQMKPIVESNRLYIEWLRHIKGIGILTSARIIAYFEPYWAEMKIVTRRKKQHKGKKLDKDEVTKKKLYPPKSRSSLNKLCDYIVINNGEKQQNIGRAERRIRNHKTSGNPKYKSIHTRTDV